MFTVQNVNELGMLLLVSSLLSTSSSIFDLRFTFYSAHAEHYLKLKIHLFRFVVDWKCTTITETHVCEQLKQSPYMKV